MDDFKSTSVDFIALGASMGVVLMWKDILTKFTNIIAGDSFIVLLFSTIIITIVIIWIAWKFPAFRRRAISSRHGE